MLAIVHLTTAPPAMALELSEDSDDNADSVKTVSPAAVNYACTSNGQSISRWLIVLLLLLSLAEMIITNPYRTR